MTERDEAILPTEEDFCYACPDGGDPNGCNRLERDGDTCEHHKMFVRLQDEITRLESALAEAQRRAEAAEQDLDNAQPCFACEAFERNGGPCFGSGRCRVAALRTIICNEPYDDASEWKWRGPDGREAK